MVYLKKGLEFRLFVAEGSCGHTLKVYLLGPADKPKHSLL